MKNKKSNEGHIKGITQLIADAVIHTTNLVEDAHRQIVHPPLLPSTFVQKLITKIAGISYNGVRWGTHAVSKQIEKGLEHFDIESDIAHSTPQHRAVHAALNGVIGDYLKASNNPLQIQLHFRHKGDVVSIDKAAIAQSYPSINGKILLLIHGSCMNDLLWTREGHDHGIALAEALGFTPIYVCYNSGLHISNNGRMLTRAIQELIGHWPVPVEELTILAHSMGGLVTRSAVYYADVEQLTWSSYLKKIFFLGTPHHGAPLEQAGSYIDHILTTIPYTRPFARLAKIRSAGVTDLRYGNITDADWKDYDRFQLYGDQRVVVPLPSTVSCYSIAAITAATATSTAAQLVGDGLVGVDSALGKHTDQDRDLQFDVERTWLAYEHNHLDLLSSGKVYEQLKRWIVESEANEQ
ncbi:MAG: alpha/beta hydrolase [Bacteroidota bacterium]